MIRLALIDDHEVVRQGFASLLQCESDIKIVASVGNVASAMMAVRDFRPDVLLLDLFLSDGDGFQVLESVNKACHVVVLSSFGGDDNVLRALDLGARGYVLKTAGIAEVVRVIRRVARGDIALSARLHLVGEAGARLTDAERRVLDALAEGASNQQIGDRLGIGLPTVKSHVHHVLQKLSAQSRTEAIAKARRMGILLR